MIYPFSTVVHKRSYFHFIFDLRQKSTKNHQGKSYFYLVAQLKVGQSAKNQNTNQPIPLVQGAGNHVQVYHGNHVQVQGQGHDQ